MDEKNIKTIHKLLPVIRVMFSTAGKRYPWFFVLETLKTLVQVAQPFVGILITPLLVDELCGPRNIRTLAAYAAILIVGEYILTLLSERFSMMLQKYQERLDNYFTMQISRHSMGLDFQLTEDKAALDQLEKARTGMTWYSGGAYGIAEQIFMFLGNIFKVAGFVTIITMHAPFLLIVILIYVALNGVVTSRLNKVELESYGRLSKVNRLFGYFGWEIVDFRFGKDIRLYDARRMLVSKWKDYTAESIAGWKWQADRSYPYNLFLAGTEMLGALTTYGYVGILVIRKVLSIGTFTQMISTAMALNATLGGLVWNIQELMKRCNYAYEYVLFMDYPEAIPKGTAHVEKGEHRIEFRNVTFAYPGTDTRVLDGINITIEPGEHLSIVGLNGAGKTTFIKLLCRLYDPTDGEILMDGRNIKEYDYKEYMAQFAPVFQDFKLFGFTIRENIAFEDIDQSRVDELMKLVELDGMAGKLDKGLDTRIFKIFEEDGIEPSGGEQQKLAIARALYKNTPVIILDEPTAALDPVAEYEIYRQFHTLVGDKTAFYISHRLSSCRFCDRIAVFADGKIAEYGSHDELADISGGIYAKMFEAQAQYYK
ncbi:MAG: ABC transporter ATP-binding protein/permease [Acetatifactor sp.]|nr:ABC transporter ATP-binding protein/permease [Acetatifactor sp.]